MANFRLCAVATSEPGVGVVEALKASPEVAHIVVIGGEKADFKGSSLLRKTMAEGTRGHIMADDAFSGSAASFFRSAEYPEILMEAMDTLQRGADEHAYRPHGLKHPTDYADYIGIVADRLARFLTEEDITHVVFFDIPHLFYDSLLYRLALHLGIKTMILRVGFDPARFYSMEEIAHYGHMRRVSPLAPSVTVEKAGTQEVYYMKGIGQEQGPRGRLTWRSLGLFAAYVVTQEPSLLVRPLALALIIRRMARAARALPEWRDPYWKFFHTGHLDYVEKIGGLENQPVNMEQRYVYFPLQFQPEMTTTILGGTYRNQLMALEQLAAILPPDVKILVKENPKQTGQYRSPMFFHRLNRIKAVEILPSHANTHRLAAQAECVATISSTAAWEAVTLGKPALLFGVSWMGDMPGVVRFREGLTYDDLLSTRFTHEDVEAAYGNLVAASHEGVVTRWAIRHLGDVNEVQNTQRIAETLVGLLKGEIPPTFTAPETRGNP